MKKQILLTLSILLPFLAKAQFGDTKNARLGFTLTPNIGWLRFNDNDPGTESNGSRGGFSYGVLGDFAFADNSNYFFSTAFTVTSINGKARITANNSTTNNIYKLQYIEVPVTLKLKSNPAPIGRFYGQFGLGTGVKISAKSDVTTMAGSAPAAKDENISDNINIFRLSLIAGGGAEWNVGKNMAIQTGLTLNNGFTDIFDGAPNARSSYFALNLGIFF